MSDSTELKIAATPFSRRAVICGLTALSLGFLPEVAQAATGVVQTKTKKLSINLKANKVLAKVGGVVTVDLADGSTLAVVRTAPGISGFTALNLSCPHNGVTVMEVDKAWLCPAHGSEFALNGKLKRGPARTALMKYPVKATSSAVIVG